MFFLLTFQKVAGLYDFWASCQVYLLQNFMDLFPEDPFSSFFRNAKTGQQSNSIKAVESAV